jgi:acetyl-CoA C-acetyltransferase
MPRSSEKGHEVHEAVIVGAVRTPIGRFGGAFAAVPAVELGATAVRAAVQRSGVADTDVARVLLGQVLQAGAGQNPARQVALRAGLGMSVPAETLNKVCLSGMSAIAHARDTIRLGEADVVIAGGFESMSTAPYLLERARHGYRYGDGTLVDVLVSDGLTCAFDACSMGAATERYQRTLGITRQEQDEAALRSHERAAAATRSGAFATEIEPVVVTGGRGAAERTVDEDEGIRATDLAALAALRPAFDVESSGARSGEPSGPPASITAGNASQLSDGAAALVLASAEHAERNGLTVLGRIVSTASVAGPDLSLLHQPADAVRRAAQQVGLDAAGLDAYEINEAFASVAIASQRALGVPDGRVNIRGGAIALGHPLGCSGARIVVTLLGILRDAGGGRGAAALCGGGGQGEALIVEVDG